jgi:hypothetical protein
MRTIFTNASVCIKSDHWLSTCDNVSRVTELKIEQLYPSINVLWQVGFEFPIYSRTENSVFLVPDEKEIERIEQEYAWVKPMVGHNPLGQFQASFNFLSLCRKQKDWTPYSTTYGLKHDVEQVSGIYISEGVFIRAALLAGFALKQAYADGSCKMNFEYDAVHYYMVKVLKDIHRQTDRRLTGNIQAEKCLAILPNPEVGTSLQGVCII